MLKAIKDLLDDESFHVPLEPAATAFKQATCVYRWASETTDHQVFDTFHKGVQLHLQSCLPQSTSSGYETKSKTLVDYLTTKLT